MSAAAARDITPALSVRPGGPRGVRGLLAFTTFARDPLGFLERLAAAYPGAARLRIPGTTFVYLTDLDAVGEVLLDRERRFSKDWTTRTLDVILGEGLFTSEGERWRRQRQLVAPPLQRKQIAAYADTMAAPAAALVDDISRASSDDDGVFAARPAMMQLTLEIVAETLFGTTVGNASADVAAALDEALAAFEKLIYTWRRMLPRRWPQPVRTRLARAAGRLDTIVRGLIDQRRRAGGAGDDLLGRLLAARDEGGAGMDDQQLRDEAVTILLAGHETTAMAMCFALWFLTQHLDVAVLARAEVDAVLGGRLPTADDTRRLPLVTAIIKETLRLHPPLWVFGRQALEDCQVGRYQLRAGEQVLIAPWVNHRDPRHFPDPTRFAPERWLDGLEERLPRHAYLPFGGGSRVCAGMHFALMEAVIILTVMLQRLEIEALPGYQLQLNPAVTLRPRDNLPLRVRLRPPR
jgi:cytochrome P450